MPNFTSDNTLSITLIMDLFNELGKALIPHADLVGMGINSDQAMRIVTNKDLSFTAKPMSFTETYRSQLKVIAQGIDVNINNLLNMLTPPQVEQVIDQHKHIEWHCPNNGEPFFLNCIEGRRGNWIFGFDNQKINDGDAPLITYRLHELEIQDVLSFMATIENVIAP